MKDGSRCQGNIRANQQCKALAGKLLSEEVQEMMGNVELGVGNMAGAGDDQSGEVGDEDTSI
jgi:hypothetical protein